MSSYLTFYLKVKEIEKPVSLISYSRSTDIYQYFSENINPAYIGMDDETKYTELKQSDVDAVIADMNIDIAKAKKRIEEYEKHAGGSQEIIEEILNWKEYIEDLEYWVHKVEFIKELVIDSGYSYCSYDKVLCNVD